MLVQELQQIFEIDERIAKMHQELSDLYDLRSSILKPKQTLATEAPIQTAQTAKTKTTESAAAEVAQQAYEAAQTAWTRYDIDMPSFDLLAKRLEKAAEIREQLEAAEPEIGQHLQIITVPTSSQIAKILNTETKEEGFVIEEEVTTPRRSKKWRVLLAYGRQKGISMQPDDFFVQKKYMINGRDMRGLGVTEYIALTVHQTELIDTDQWTMLLKGGDKSATAPCVMHTGDAYRFVLDEKACVFDDNTFRPALEIK